eukprot:GHVL01030970.1.p1 GENE.GHVL01030970.1~~GHVL01030970.1.p1  ORF type:complete len:116 (+),score=22.01 GHVL01030970.1:111-458(+)
MAKGIDNKSANGHNRSRNADDMNPQGPHTSFPPSVQMGRPLTFSDRVTPEETYTVTDVVNNIRLGDTGWRDEFLNMLQVITYINTKLITFTHQGENISFLDSRLLELCSSSIYIY